MSQSGVNSISQAVGSVSFLEGNVGGPVPPNGADTIFIVGSGSISVNGNAGTNTLTISSSPVAAWNLIGASQTMAPNQGYFCTGGGALVLTLPVASNIGDIIQITLDGSASWQIAQTAGQRVRIGNLQTTLGVGGSITSTQQGDTVYLVCQIANLKWNVLSSMGNLIVV